MTAAVPERAEVVVVGGGVIGSSVAFHLAEAGVDVCLLERSELASGSTSRAAGGVRAQFSDPLNISLGLRSIEAYTNFAERPGAEIDLKQVGYLFLLDRPEDVASFEQSIALQNEHGVPSRFVDLEEVQRLCPIAGLEGVLAATFSPLDGHASPEAVVQGYAAGARRHGATVVTGCARRRDRPRRGTRFEASEPEPAGSRPRRSCVLQAHGRRTSREWSASSSP